MPNVEARLLPRRPERPRWPQDSSHEEDGMRLVAALLCLGTLLVWILFLEG
jgi:hypothetical protein